MSYSSQPPRYSGSSYPRQSSLGTSAATAGLYSAQQTQSPALIQRINEKKEELENLIQLRELSAALAQQMEQLEEKLSTLADGTQAVAHVLANWQNVLRAIAMASTPLTKIRKPLPGKHPFIPKEMSPQEPAAEDDGKLLMPITLVRIPTQHFPNVANSC